MPKVARSPWVNMSTVPPLYHSIEFIWKGISRTECFQARDFERIYATCTLRVVNGVYITTFSIGKLCWLRADWFSKCVINSYIQSTWTLRMMLSASAFYPSHEIRLNPVLTLVQPGWPLWHSQKGGNHLLETFSWPLVLLIRYMYMKDSRQWVEAAHFATQEIMCT